MTPPTKFRGEGIICPACRQVDVVVIPNGWDEYADKGVCEVCFFEWQLEEEETA